MKPFLIVDCYVDGDGAANYHRLLSGHEKQVYRALHEPRPAEATRFGGIVISGSAASVTAPEPWMDGLVSLVREAADDQVPVLGVCFGHQIVAHALCGPDAVRKAETPEIGWRDIEVIQPDPILEGLGTGFRTFESHFDEVDDGLEGIAVLARSSTCAVQSYRIDNRPMWGVQFHPEMTLEESRDLAARRIGGRPDLGMSLDDELARAVDSAWLAERLIHNFIACCGENQ